MQFPTPGIPKKKGTSITEWGPVWGPQHGQLQGPFSTHLCWCVFSSCFEFHPSSLDWFGSVKWWKIEHWCSLFEAISCSELSSGVCTYRKAMPPHFWKSQRVFLPTYNLVNDHHNYVNSCFQGDTTSTILHLSTMSFPGPRYSPCSVPW